MSVGDFNGDGASDLVTANSDDNSVSVLLGQGDGTFAALAVRTRRDPPIRWRWGTSTATGPAIWSLPNYTATACRCCWARGRHVRRPGHYAVGGCPYSVAVGDFNGDGASDLVTANVQRYVSVLLGQGHGTYVVPWM